MVDRFGRNDKRRKCSRRETVEDTIMGGLLQHPFTTEACTTLYVVDSVTCIAFKLLRKATNQYRTQCAEVLHIPSYPQL